MTSIIVPVRLKSTANLSEFWATRAARVKRERTTTALAVRAHLRRPTVVDPQFTVRLTWLRSGRPVDSDNLARACKAIRDGVADALGMDDGDPHITWLYAQEVGKPGVRIEIHALAKTDSDALAKRLRALQAEAETRGEQLLRRKGAACLAPWVSWCVE